MGPTKATATLPAQFQVKSSDNPGSPVSEWVKWPSKHPSRRRTVGVARCRQQIVPVLQAAHIRPVTDHGVNRVDNRLLFRSYVHALFDRGYLGVHPRKKTLLVSPRLRADWGNGDEFYQRAVSGETIGMPRRRVDRPNEDFLTWHADTVFRASRRGDCDGLGR
jgi:hypothetical protein